MSEKELKPVENQEPEDELSDEEMDDVSGGAIYMDFDNRLSAKLNLSGDSLDKSTPK